MPVHVPLRTHCSLALTHPYVFPAVVLPPLTLTSPLSNAASRGNPYDQISPPWAAVLEAVERRVPRRGPELTDPGTAAQGIATHWQRPRGSLYTPREGVSTTLPRTRGLLDL